MAAYLVGDKMKRLKRITRNRLSDLSPLDLLLLACSFWVTFLLQLYHLHGTFDCHPSQYFEIPLLAYISNGKHHVILYSLLTNMLAVIGYFNRETRLLVLTRLNFVIYWFAVAITSLLFTNYDFLTGFASILFATAFYLYTNTHFNFFVSLRRKHE
jgi:hypothetical protein